MGGIGNSESCFAFVIYVKYSQTSLSTELTLVNTQNIRLLVRTGLACLYSPGHPGADSPPTHPRGPLYSPFVLEAPPLRRVGASCSYLNEEGGE